MCSFGTERLGQKPQSTLDERITEQMFEVRKPAIMMHKGKTRTDRGQAKVWRCRRARHCDRQARVLREVTQWHRLGGISMKQILGVKLS